MNRLRSWALAIAGAILCVSIAHGQGEISSGHVWGNSSASQREPRGETLTAMFDRAFSSTQNMMLYRAAGSWQALSAANIVAIAGITSAADKCFYFSGAGTAATFDCAVGIRTFIGTPSSANLASALTDETGSGLAVFNNSPVLTTPDINGGTADALTSLGIRSTNAAFDLLFASTEVLTGNRTIFWNVGNASRNVTFGGTVNLGGLLATTGDITFTCAATCGVTLPPTGTLAALAGTNTWANTQTFTVAPVFTDAPGSRTALGLGTAAVQNTGTSGANIPFLNGTNTWANAQTFTAAPVFTDASGSRTALGLGTAAVQNTGTSGANIPFLNGNNTYSGSSTFSGAVDVQAALSASGDISPTALAGHVDDYNPTGLSTATVLRIDGGAADRNITGLAGGADGLIKIILNIGATNSLVLKNATTSTAANQFKFGADITLAVDQGAVLWYDATSSRWRALAVFTTAGGGGGTLTSVATTYPICGGTITTSGTLTYCGPTFAGRLTYVNATTLAFAPFNGDAIRINGVVYQIPAAGIAGCGNTSVFVNGSGASNLAASTLYYVYAFNNGGTITCDYSATGHATSTAVANNIGTEVKNGDSTRSLIGMVFTNASNQFDDSAALRHVASWFNQRSRLARGTLTTNRSTTSTTFVELNSEIRASFVTWGDALVLSAPLDGTNDNAGGGINWQQFGLDGVSTLLGGPAVFLTTDTRNAGMSSAYEASEGKHYITLAVKVSAGTGTWYFTANERGFINVVVRQ